MEARVRFRHLSLYLKRCNLFVLMSDGDKEIDGPGANSAEQKC